MQNKTGRFTFLVSDQDRQIIAGLAFRLQRSQSDAIRFVLAAASLQLEAPVKANFQFDPNPAEMQTAP